jgi:hypothetical protein
MDDCDMQTNKKQESTRTDIDRRGGGGRGLEKDGRRAEGRLASTLKNWGEKVEKDDDEGGK